MGMLTKGANRLAKRPPAWAAGGAAGGGGAGVAGGVLCAAPSASDAAVSGKGDAASLAGEEAAEAAHAGGDGAGAKVACARLSARAFGVTATGGGALAMGLASRGCAFSAAGVILALSGSGWARAPINCTVMPPCFCEKLAGPAACCVACTHTARPTACASTDKASAPPTRCGWERRGPAVQGGCCMPRTIARPLCCQSPEKAARSCVFKKSSTTWLATSRCSQK